MKEYITNERRIKAMSTEELAEYLFDRGNCSEYCYGICAYQDDRKRIFIDIGVPTLKQSVSGRRARRLSHG